MWLSINFDEELIDDCRIFNVFDGIFIWEVIMLIINGLLVIINVDLLIDRRKNREEAIDKNLINNI